MTTKGLIDNIIKGFQDLIQTLVDEAMKLAEAPLIQAAKDAVPPLIAPVKAKVASLDNKINNLVAKVGSLEQRIAKLESIVIPPALVAVPNVVGKTIPEATAIIEKAKLRVGSIMQKVVSKGVLLGTVIEQRPRAGVKVPMGSPISLIIARPEIVGGPILPPPPGPAPAPAPAPEI